MRQLPGTGDAECGKLDEHPTNDTAVGRLRLISELCLPFLGRPSTKPFISYVVLESQHATHTLEHLFPSDIRQPSVEILDTVGDVLQLALIGGLDLVGLANDNVESQTDAAVR